ncbi:MAG: N5-carboxyaminoimidazole ribonucleotide synthase [Firmicutes bacterium]|nr:N5-carboxyaminoimidazole ribonucleotide synthase [Bacillota bacterium]
MKSPSLPLPPGSTIGILGGGQLGRMTAMAAKAMGYQVLCLDPTPASPCGQVCDGQVIGSLSDPAAAFALARQADLVIYEFENIAAEVIRALEEHHHVPQGSRILAIAQNRILEKGHLVAHGFPVAPYRVVHAEEDLAAAVAEVGLPAVLKSATGGYDGKGQLVMRDDNGLSAGLAMVARGGSWVVEEFLEPVQEVSVIIARRASGESRIFPLAENSHRENVLSTTIVPARVSPQVEQKALAHALGIANSLDLVGILAVEMFVTARGVIVNELAPRPHNSGHFSLGACYTSQFEQFVRAVAGLPLGSTDLLYPALMVNILGRDMDSVRENWATLQRAGQVHLYGKSGAPEERRKMGHLLMRTTDPEGAKSWVEGVLRRSIV